MKNKIFLATLFIAPLSLLSCNGRHFSSVPDPIKPGHLPVYDSHKGKKLNSIMPDTCFRNGMTLVDGQGKNIDYGGTAESGSKYWTMAAWNTINPIRNAIHTRKNNTSTYQDASHNFSIDNDDGELKWHLNGIAEYKTPAGKKVLESGNWTHLLISCNFDKSKWVKPSEIEKAGKHLYYTFDSKITYQEIVEPESKVNANCAQLLAYFQLKYTEGDKLPGGGWETPCDEKTNRYKRWMWVGCPIYDTRFDGNDLDRYYANDSLSPSGTNMYIYSCGTRDYPNYYHKSGVQNSVKVDLIPIFKEALNKAHEHNFMTDATWENVCLNYYNFGYEVPGYVSIGATVGNIDVFIE